MADLIVNHAVDRHTNKGVKKLTQARMAEEAGVTERTIRNWHKDELFLEYVGYLSRMRLQAAMPDFVGVLIANLEKGQNVSTKQLDLIAKVADWMPEKQNSENTYNINVGGQSELENRIQALTERKRKEVVEVPPKRIETDAEEAEYRDGD